MSVYYKYSEYLKQKYGCKVYKIPVNLPVTCPVRDGAKDSSGCIFCGENAAGYECRPADMPINEQIAMNIGYISKKYSAEKFDIYFQNYTATYTDVKTFERYADEAMNSSKDIVRLTLSTRPDCVANEYLDILRMYSQKFNVDICIELGLQSINPNTLKKLNRHHNLSQYISAVEKIKVYGFEICTHIISTLPWDTDEDVIEAARLVSVLNTDSVKLHTLYVEKNTVLEKMYLNGEIKMLSLEDYIRRTVAFIEHLKSSISIQRLSARVQPENSVFANWNRSHWVLDDMVVDELNRKKSTQGIKCDYFSEESVAKYL